MLTQSMLDAVSRLMSQTGKPRPRYLSESSESCPSLPSVRIVERIDNESGKLYIDVKQPTSQGSSER